MRKQNAGLERLSIEQKLAEEKYRSLVESTDDSVYVVDKDYRYIYMNKKNLSRFDLPIDKVIGKAYGGFHSQEGSEKFKERINSVLRTRRSKTHEYRSERDEKYFLRTYSPIIGADGKPEAVTVISKDISILKKAEKEIRRSEKLYKGLVEKSGIAILMDDREGNFIYWNRIFAKLFGYSFDEMKELSIRNLVHPDDLDRVTNNHTRRIQGKRSLSRYEFKGVKKDGAIFYLEVAAEVLEEDGKIIGTRSYVWDITKRKQAEEALRNQQQELQIILDTVPAMIFYKDKEDRFLRVNQVMADTFGLPKDEIIGKSAKELSPTEKDYFKDDQKVIKFNQPKYNIIEPVETSEGILWLRTDKIPYKDSEGNTIGIVGFSMDITERKQAEEDLKTYQVDLKRLSTQLITAQEDERKRISQELHDEVGQALTALKINLTTIASQLQSDMAPSVKERFAEADDLTDNLLEQIQNMALDLRPSILDDLGLAPALRWYVKSFKKRTNIKTQFKVVNVKERLKPEIEISIYRIVQEALTNVAKYAEADLVNINLKEKKSEIELSIEDNGEGFDLEEVRSRPQSAHGIGLLGIQERIALLKGTTQILTQPKMGTKIIINVPRRFPQ